MTQPPRQLFLPETEQTLQELRKRAGWSAMTVQVRAEGVTIFGHLEHKGQSLCEMSSYEKQIITLRQRYDQVVAKLRKAIQAKEQADV